MRTGVEDRHQKLVGAIDHASHSLAHARESLREDSTTVVSGSGGPVQVRARAEVARVARLLDEAREPGRVAAEAIEGAAYALDRELVLLAESSSCRAHVQGHRDAPRGARRRDLGHGPLPVLLGASGRVAGSRRDGRPDAMCQRPSVGRGRTPVSRQRMTPRRNAEPPRQEQLATLRPRCARRFSRFEVSENSAILRVRSGGNLVLAFGHARGGASRGA